jgi:hypothetical protein
MLRQGRKARKGMKNRLVRRLIWVPVIHTEADLGGMSEPVRRLYVAKMGRAKWERHIRAIRTFWSRVEEQIDAWGLAYERLRLYQDGLPYCGREAEIVRTLAEAGSLNCRLLLKLMERGARITGTESPELLLAEYDLARKSLPGERAGKPAPAQAGRPAGKPARRAFPHRRLLDLRDRYIAARIDETLEPGDTGLIFLGMLHSLDGRLPADICVMQARVNMPGHQAAKRE